MKILITTAKIQSALKGAHIYANQGDAVEMIGSSGEVGFYRNTFTDEKFPARIEHIMEVEVDVMPTQKIEEKIVKQKKGHNPNQISMF